MDRVYVIPKTDQDPMLLRKLESMWLAEKRLLDAVRAHDGSARTYEELDRAVAAYTAARFGFQLAAFDHPPVG